MIQIISEIKTIDNQFKIEILTSFPTANYKETFGTSIYIINKFKWMINQNWGYKPYHFLKKHSKLIRRIKEEQYGTYVK